MVFYFRVIHNIYYNVVLPLALPYTVVPAYTVVPKMKGYFENKRVLSLQISSDNTLLYLVKWRGLKS